MQPYTRSRIFCPECEALDLDIDDLIGDLDGGYQFIRCWCGWTEIARVQTERGSAFRYAGGIRFDCVTVSGSFETTCKKCGHEHVDHRYPNLMGIVDCKYCDCNFES